MNEFRHFHPIVNFTYFVFVIGFSAFFMHPLSLFVSFVCAFIYSALIGGRKTVKKNLLFIIPLIILTALINPLFNHDGKTVLLYLPDMNPLTLESIIYGVCAAFMISGVILWFSCYTEVMTSDKFIYLFGRILPSLSLVLSMTLRFVPKFSEHMKTVINAQKCLGRDMSQGNVFTKAKNGLTIISSMVTWSLENAIETADSMKARGYGIGRRSSFSIFRFDKRDTFSLIVILLLGSYTLVGGIFGGMYFRYFPSFKSVGVTPFVISVFAAYFALLIYPVILELWEVRKWKALRSKI